MRNCRLGFLTDLALGTADVRAKIATYLNHLLFIGVGGFRMDACKHMWAEDLELVYDLLEYNDSSRPFVYNEVIDLGGEPITGDEYTHLGRVTDFKYGRDIGDCFRNWNDQKIAYLKDFGWGWGYLDDKDAFVFVDNHDNQRGHGAGGASILSFKVPHLYKRAVAFKLAWPFGFTRIMSSYDFNNTDAGPPSDDGEIINDVPINDDGSCGGGWMCEHRWRPIYSMVQFRNLMGGNNVTYWWDNDENQIVFSVGKKGFVAINNEEADLVGTHTSGLPAGTYCDVISGEKTDDGCTGIEVEVSDDGVGSVTLALSSNGDGILAIHPCEYFN